MKNITPDLILWSVIPLVFLPLALGFDSAMDFQIHDTYYVFAILHIAILFAMVLGVLGALYRLFLENDLNSFLSNVHSIGTSLCLVGIMIAAGLFNLYEKVDFDLFSTINSVVLKLIAAFLLLQLIFVFNVILSYGRPKG